MERHSFYVCVIYLQYLLILSPDVLSVLYRIYRFLVIKLPCPITPIRVERASTEPFYQLHVERRFSQHIKREYQSFFFYIHTERTIVFFFSVPIFHPVGSFRALTLPTNNTPRYILPPSTYIYIHIHINQGQELCVFGCRFLIVHDILVPVFRSKLSIIKKEPKRRKKIILLFRIFLSKEF